MTTTQLVPSHFKKFSCIGSDCENHCCQGWVVPVDKKTYKKYQNSNDKSLGKNIKRFKGNNDNLPYASIQMKECGMCPFFMENGLCYIHSTYGEEMLSSVCSVFPRVKNIFNNVLEQSLYLSCPEAARITLLNNDPMEFDLETYEQVNLTQIGKQDDILAGKSTLSNNFFLLRSLAIELIQNRSWNLKIRLLLLGFWIQQLEKWEGMYLTDEEISEGWANFIFTHSELIKNGAFDSLLQDTKGIEDHFVVFIQALFSSRVKHNDTSYKYQQLVATLLENLEWKDGTFEDWTNSYIKIKEKSSEFIQEKEYILENFIVNEIFKDWFPFGEDSMWNHYLSIIMNFTLLRVHFMSIISETGSLNDSNIIEHVHLFVRASLHRKSFVINLIKYAKDNQMNNIGAVVLLLN
ncbi:flagellin lysine-N-methylase [Gottfriedia solisilvae]|uniref:flagellin lysine-N-methylase n=1 Tax=Gottfriedia solisilvae TaxID=1516104 RepID=UPI003D2F06C7